MLESEFLWEWALEFELDLAMVRETVKERGLELVWVLESAWELEMG